MFIGVSSIYLPVAVDVSVGVSVVELGQVGPLGVPLHPLVEPLLQLSGDQGLVVSNLAKKEEGVMGKVG